MPGVAQAAGFLEEGHGVENDAVADDAAALGAQHAAGHELENELLAVDDDGVAGVVPAGIARDDGEALAQHIDDLAFALIAPLGANYHCRLRLGHRIACSFLIPGVPHTRSLFACGSLSVMLRGPWVGRMRESVHPIPDHISAGGRPKDDVGGLGFCGFTGSARTSLVTHIASLFST